MAILLISLLHFHLLLHTKIVKTLGMPSCFLIKWTHKEIPDCKTTSLPILSFILPNSIYWFKWSSNLKKDFVLFICLKSIYLTMWKPRYIRYNCWKHQQSRFMMSGQEKIPSFDVLKNISQKDLNTTSL